jgi:hypothetical protein
MTPYKRLIITRPDGKKEIVMPKKKDNNSKKVQASMPDRIWAYHVESGTGTWIDFDDSYHKSGDVATEYTRIDVSKEEAQGASKSFDEILKYRVPSGHTIGQFIHGELEKTIRRLLEAASK